MNPLIPWGKHQTMLFLNVNKDNQRPQNWARIGKSTIFDLALNPNIQTQDFIEDENPTDTLQNYKPTINQELAAMRGDKAFDAMFDFAFNLPTGPAATRDGLLIFPALQTPKSDADGPKYFAWLTTAGISVTNFNAVDKKILFGINFAGNIEKGYAQVVAGVPVFTPFEDQSIWVDTADATPAELDEPTEPDTP